MNISIECSVEIFPTALQVSVHFMLILTHYQAHPPQLGLLVVRGLRRLANFNLSIGPLRTKLLNNMVDENGCQGDEKALYGVSKRLCKFPEETESAALFLCCCLHHL